MIVRLSGHPLVQDSLSRVLPPSRGPNLRKHCVPRLLLPLDLDAQFGTPYPRSAGFDTDSHVDLSIIGLVAAKYNSSGVGVKTGGSRVGGPELCV